MNKKLLSLLISGILATSCPLLATDNDQEGKNLSRIKRFSSTEDDISPVISKNLSVDNLQALLKEGVTQIGQSFFKLPSLDDNKTKKNISRLINFIQNTNDDVGITVSLLENANKPQYKIHFTLNSGEITLHPGFVSGVFFVDKL